MGRVKSVVLRTLNRGKLTVAVEAFLKTGRVPTLQGNMMENIFSFLWLKDGPIVLGPRFRDAFQDPNSCLAIEPIFEAHVLLYIIRSSNSNQPPPRKHQDNNNSVYRPSITDLAAHITESYKMVSALYGPFKSKATEQNNIVHLHDIGNDYAAHNLPDLQGWVMSESLLNPGRARLCGAVN
ncbi:root UVB sensitive protein [Actinidia rufa]|uniref:Root UVB sensitive protein n=1 Tax=Actinidia rufa TaxID=165716 RepID=A0A7J0F705_9ERIC|nr:root UVB sensitive protein [Actinidia rufa]